MCSNSCFKLHRPKESDHIFVTIVLENSMDTGFTDITMVFEQPMGFVLGGVSVHRNWLAKAHLSVRGQWEVSYYRTHCSWLSPGKMIQMILWGKSPNGHSKVCINKLWNKLYTGFNNFSFATMLRISMQFFFSSPSLLIFLWKCASKRVSSAVFIRY